MIMKHHRRYLVVLALLLLPMLGILLQPASAGIIQSGNLTTQVPLYGRRLVVHPNVANFEDYYAVLYNDASGNLRLAAFNYISNALQFTQQVVPSSQWMAASYGGYVISNCPSTYFYIVYHWTWNTIGARRVTFNYTTTGTLYNFIIGYPITIAASNILYNSGFDALLMDDGTLWVAFIYQTGVLNAQIAQYDPVSEAAWTTTSIALNFLQIWTVQLAKAAGQVYAFTYGIALQDEGGRLYDTAGHLLYTTTYWPKYASMISLSTGNLAVVYQAMNNVVATVTYDGSTATEAMIMVYSGMTDLSAFALPNQYYGFYFTDSSGLSLMYYGYSYASVMGWSAVTAVLSNPSGYTQAPLSADRDAVMRMLIAHPTVWSYFAPPSGNGYGNLISVNLAATNSVTFTTYWIETTITVYTTATSLSSVYSRSTTLTTTNTQSLSALQTPTFLMNLILLVMFLVLPAGLLGFFLGLLGFTVGALVGSIVAFAFALLPFWLLLVIVLIMAALIFLFREDMGKV